MSTFGDKPLAVQFPELNSWQISKLRQMLKAEYERGAIEAKSALYDLILKGVVGEDEVNTTIGHIDLTTDKVKYRNQLKQEMRNKLKDCLMTDIDTQIESLPKFEHDHLCQIRQQDGDDSTCTCVERQLFNMVYQWGRVGVVTDWTAPAFQTAIKTLLIQSKIDELEKLDELKEVDDTYSTNTKILYSVPFERIVTRTNQLKEEL